jgi:glycosyltransferase involved in cell wall biosynthesis
VKAVFVINVDFALHHFLLPLMRGARARGHEVIGVCAEGPLLATARAEGFRIIPIPLVRRLSPLANWRALTALTTLFREERPALVHAHMPISGLLARLAARAAGVPTIAYTCHGFLFNQPGPFPRRAASLLLEWLGGRLTHIFLTVSTAEASDARRLHIARNPHPVGNGRDPALFRPNPAARHAVRTALGVPNDRIVVISVSRQVRHKGIPELLHAMRGQNAELWLVGARLPSDRGEDLDPHIAAAALGPNLRRLGARDDVPDLLAAADIFALPSHFEGLPMSIIEAMLTALPVIATNISGPNEQVIDGETGLLVPPATIPPLAAALATLIDNPTLRATLGAAGRTRAIALFDEATVVSRTLDVLRL